MSDERFIDEASVRDSDLMDSLLQQTMHPNSDEDERRMNELMATIRGEQPTSVEFPTPTDRRRRWLRASFTAAALFLGVVLLTSTMSQRSALAAVDRSLIAEEAAGAREYEIRVVSLDERGAELTSSHSLYVSDRRFVIQWMPKNGKTSVWFGGDDS